MTAPFPFETRSAWDRITVAGIAFSGKVEIEGAGRTRKVDVPKRAGADGAYPILQRRELSEPRITLTGWTREHLAELERIARACFPLDRTEQHNAVAVEHPVLALHGIDKVLVHHIEGPTLDGDTFALELQTYQYRPPPPASRSGTRRVTEARPIETRPTAFQGVEQPTPAPPSTTTTPRRRTP